MTPLIILQCFLIPSRITCLAGLKPTRWVSVKVFKLSFLIVQSLLIQKKSPEVLYKKSCSKKLIFTGKHMCWRLFFNKVTGLTLQCLFSEHLRVTASGFLYQKLKNDYWSYNSYRDTESRSVNPLITFIFFLKKQKNTFNKNFPFLLFVKILI